MWKRLLALVVVAACNDAASRLDGIGASTPAPAPAPAPASAPPALEDRLARVERRLDRVITLLEQTLPPSAPSANDSDVHAVPVDPIDPVLGPADAKVTIIEVLEIPCARCQALSKLLDDVRAKYPADVRVVAKYLPVRGTPSVMPGLVACAAARQGKYAVAKRALWQAAGLDDEAVQGLAVAAGLERAALEGDLVACQAWLTKSQATLRAFGVTAPPAVFVNGRYAEGALTQPTLDAMVRTALDEATAAIAGGVPAAAYYERAILARGARRARSRFDD